MPAVAGEARVCWVDLIFPYLQTPQAYRSPLLTGADKPLMNNPFAHTAPGGVEVAGATEYSAVTVTTTSIWGTAGSPAAGWAQSR